MCGQFCFVCLFTVLFDRLARNNPSQILFDEKKSKDKYQKFECFFSFFSSFRAVSDISTYDL